jgi:hypothetical protein
LIWRTVLYSDEVKEVALLMVVDWGDKRSVISVRLPKRFEIKKQLILVPLNLSTWLKLGYFSVSPRLYNDELSFTWGADPSDEDSLVW